MRIGLIISTVAHHQLPDLARRAEQLGFDSLWAGEHIVLPMRETETHPYGRPGVVQPLGETWAPFVQLAALAGITSRIRLATGVILPPLRNVFATAREMVTLDLMSGGRLDVGVGVGWHSGEFALMGADFKSRGAYTDEFIDALDRLFTERTPSFQGRHIAFEPVGFEPKPMQKPRPPVLVGGDTLPAMRRAALRGDGWYGHAGSPDEARARIATVAGLLADNGRDPAKFENVVQVWNPPGAEALRGYAEAGAHRVVTAPFERDDPAPVRTLEAYARSIGLAARLDDGG